MTPMRIPPMAVRRRNVLLLLISYPLACLGVFAVFGESSWLGIAHLVATVLILWLLAIERVGRVGKAIADDIDSRLDERQLALRNAAYLDAYRVVGGAVHLGVIWMAVGASKENLNLWMPSTYEEWNVIFWGLFIYTTTLPSAFLAWREPDRLDDLEFADA